jgi:hypothetical protein
MGYLAALSFIFLLAVGLVGAPLALLVLLGLVVLTVIGLVTTALALGHWLARRVGASQSPLAQLALGILVLFPASILPFLGWLVAAVLACYGLGAILLTRMGSGEPWSLQALKE